MKNKICLMLALSVGIGIVLANMMINFFYNNVVVVQPFTGNSDIMALVEYGASVWQYYIICIAACLFVFVFPFFYYKKFSLSDASYVNSVPLIFSTSLLGFLYAGYVVNFIIAYFRHNWSSAHFPVADLSAAAPLLKLLFYASIVMAIPSAVYFIMLSVRSEHKPSPLIGILSISPVIWFALRIVYYFILTSARVNVAGRKLYIISLCFALFFLIQDSKRWVYFNCDKADEHKTTKNSVLYLSLGFTAIVTLAASHVSLTYLQAFWLLEPYDSYFLNAIYISMIFYIVFRIYSVASSNVKQQA